MADTLDAGRGLPTGTVTFLFTDIEGSTRLLAELREQYHGLLATYYELLERATSAHGGSEVDRAGDGLLYSFGRARDAVLAAIESQRLLAAEEWPDGAAVRARMGIHTGEPVKAAIGYVGMDVHRAARIADSGHGGQILVSQTTADLVGGELPGNTSLVDLGAHWLKDLARAERLYQVAAEGLQTTFPALRSLVTRPNNLPRDLSSFVGRRHELSEAAQALERTPLVTLTGPGGVGKTRLAVQVAAESLDAYEDGVWLVELEALTDETLVLPTVNATLGIAEPEADPLQAAVRFLRARKLLLVLDNCEHVVDACARMADGLLRVCADVRILATSREALGVRGEVVQPVRSLSLPAPDDARDPDDLTQFEAVRLFVERATAADPSFVLTPANALRTVEICRRLDGIPLAVELAAARVRSLSVDQIADRLDDRFRLLTGGSRTALPRHQTLRAAIEWSIGLLSEGERAVLRRLSVFAGAFTLEAAEYVCASADVDDMDALDHLTKLVEKSLVNRHEGSYRLLETVREYSRQQLLAAGESAATYSRHRDWYVRLVESGRQHFFRGPEPTDWLDIFDREHDNLRAALQWSLNADEPKSSALRLADGLWRFWQIRGHLGEGRQWLEAALEASPVAPPELRASALTGAGILASAQGDHAGAVRLHEESLAIQRGLGQQVAIAYSLSNLANAALEAGDQQRARQLYEEAVVIASEMGDRRGYGFSVLNLADVIARQGDYPAARQRYEDGIALFRSLGDPWGTAHALASYGQAAARQGDRSTARSLYEEALEHYRKMRDRRGEARLLTLLSEVLADDGNDAAARTLLYESLGIRCQLGDTAGIATALDRLASAVHGDPVRAAKLMSAAATMRQAIGARLPLSARAAYDQQVARLQQRLGEEAFESAWSDGRRLAADEALREAAAAIAG